jgi:hypothetical protein
MNALKNNFLKTINPYAKNSHKQQNTLFKKQNPQICFNFEILTK